MKHTSIHQQPK